MPGKKNWLANTAVSGAVIGKQRQGGMHYVVKDIDRGVSLQEMHYLWNL